MLLAPRNGYSVSAALVTAVALLALVSDLSAQSAAGSRSAASRRSASRRELRAAVEQSEEELDPFGDELEVDEAVGVGRRMTLRRPRSVSRPYSVRQTALEQERSVVARRRAAPYYLPQEEMTEEYIPQRSQRRPLTVEELPPGEELPLGEAAPDEEYYAGGGEDCLACGGLGCPGGCGVCGRPFMLARCFLSNTEYFAGAQGFTGLLNRGGGSSFGFHEGFNWGGLGLCGFALQGGMDATQSNFNGSIITPEDRTQIFYTAGLFRRVDWGLQGGLVVDYFHDDWDYTLGLTQLRGELSWMIPCGHEVGYWFTGSIDQAQINLRTPVVVENTVRLATRQTTLRAANLNAFFYRRQFCCGGEGRVFGGFTDDRRGLLGGNIRLPINGCWSFTTDLMYIIPNTSNTNNTNNNTQFNFLNEAWNISFAVCWTPGARNNCGPNYCRPLFSVANNGSFIVRQK